jgi:hypothetical protein
MSRNPDNYGIVNHQLVNLIDSDSVYIKNLIIRHLYTMNGIAYGTKDYIVSKCKQDAMAMCDYGLKEMLMDGNGNVLPMASLYFMTDLGLYAKTDAGDMQDDFANKITPTSGMKGGGDENAMQRFWDRTWNSVTFANTIISNVDKVEGLDPTLRDEYLGRANTRTYAANGMRSIFVSNIDQDEKTNTKKNEIDRSS